MELGPLAVADCIGLDKRGNWKHSIVRVEGAITMRKLRYFTLIAILLCWASAVTATSSDAAEVPTISKEKVKNMLGKPNVIVVDVRADPEWDSSDFKIKGAIRKGPRKVENWFATLPKKKTLVFYCA
jgi:hypothetical protein